jgi:hypothetical protein
MRQLQVGVSQTPNEYDQACSVHTGHIYAMHLYSARLLFPEGDFYPALNALDDERDAPSTRLEVLSRTLSPSRAMRG